MAAGRSLFAALLALAAGVIALPVAAQDAPPAKSKIVITATDEDPERQLDVPVVARIWIGDLRLPETLGEKAKRRWDETHRRLDSRKGRALRR